MRILSARFPPYIFYLLHSSIQKVSAKVKRQKNLTTSKNRTWPPLDWPTITFDVNLPIPCNVVKLCQVYFHRNVRWVRKILGKQQLSGTSIWTVRIRNSPHISKHFLVSRQTRRHVWNSTGICIYLFSLSFHIHYFRGK